LITAGGLAIDAYVHADLAANFDPIETSTISQGDLFRIEAGLAALAALVIIVWSHRVAAAFAALVSLSALVVLLIYRYADVGQIGPIPNMYEPVWYAEKTWSLIGEAVAFAGALALLVLPRRADRS
jgi:hypothetical protein